jgi:hypothetical protein
MHMTDNHQGAGYSLGPEARVVLHRHGAWGSGQYSVAVIAEEGPFDRATAERVADGLRAHGGGWVTRATAAQRLGLTEARVDQLRVEGRLDSTQDSSNRARISLDSLEREIARRVGAE